MKILITGGCGFIGHHLIEHIIKTTDWEVIVWDKLTYAASGFDRLRDIDCFDNKRVRIFTVDFTHEIPEGIVKETGDINYLIHMGAETHVDNSIDNPEPFVRSNVLGTMYMLNYARNQKMLRRFVYFSTDEIFGPAPTGVEYKEWDRYNSSNPYAASKAGGEELCMAYANTYQMPIVVTHTMNAFGERQHPEKFIPMVIRKVILDETIIIHADKTKTISGSRFYIHARNIASAISFLLNNSDIREKYNIVGEKEVSNLKMTEFIAETLRLPFKHKMVDFHGERPGHDLRYALDGSKMKEIGWNLPVNFEDSLRNTIKWYLKRKNRRWLGL